MVIAIDRRNIYTEGLPRGGLFRLHHHARNEVYDLLPHDSFKAGDMHLIGPSFTAGASTTNRKKVQWRRHKFSIKEAYDSRDAGAAGRPEAIGLGAGSNPPSPAGTTCRMLMDLIQTLLTGHKWRTFGGRKTSR